MSGVGGEGSVEGSAPSPGNRRPWAVVAASLVMAAYWVTEVVALGIAYRETACGPEDEPECQFGAEIAKYFTGDSALFSLPILALAYFVLLRDVRSWRFAMGYFGLGLIACIAQFALQSDDIGLIFPAIIYPVLALGSNTSLILVSLVFHTVCVALLSIPSVYRWYRPLLPDASV